jgi:hypothetical protein
MHVKFYSIHLTERDHSVDPGLNKMGLIILDSKEMGFESVELFSLA